MRAFGPLFGVLCVHWGRPGIMSVRLGAIPGSLWHSVEPPGTILGMFWLSLGHSGPILGFLGPRVAILGQSLDTLESLWAISLYAVSCYKTENTQVPKCPQAFCPGEGN